MQRFIYLLSLLAFTSLAHAQPTFNVSIVPESCGSNSCSVSSAEKDARTFYVVLTNLSDKPQFIWETWNSWGYRSISFEITSADGKTHALTKKSQIFTRNFPSTYKILPGGHQVFPVRLDNEWDGRPIYAKAGNEPVTVKVIFEVAPSPEDSANEAWTGRVSSEAYNLDMYHW